MVRDYRDPRCGLDPGASKEKTGEIAALQCDAGLPEPAERVFPLWVCNRRRCLQEGQDRLT